MDERVRIRLKVRTVSLGAEVHTLAVTFIAGLLGFGIATQLVSGASGSAVGVVASAVIYTGICAVIDVGVRMRPIGGLTARGNVHFLWATASLTWLAVGAAVAALLAPSYQVTGVEGNAATVVIVLCIDFLVSRASPWRQKWRAPST